MKNQKTFFLTPQGKIKLETELKELRNSRVQALIELQRARSMGDLKENSAYQAAREKLTGIDRKIVKNELTLRNSEVIEKNNDGKVQIGNKVDLVFNNKRISYEIVGDSEMNLKEKKISFNSPLGKALLGKSEKDTITIQTPSGELKYQIKRVY